MVRYIIVDFAAVHRDGSVRAGSRVMPIEDPSPILVHEVEAEARVRDLFWLSVPFLFHREVHESMQSLKIVRWRIADESSDEIGAANHGAH